MKAKFNLGDVIVALPVEYLDQQTAISSVFENVPIESVDVSALIEANRHGVNWYYSADRQAMHISVPTELIEWED